MLGYPVIDGLVIALLLGLLWRNCRGVSPLLAPGVQWMAKPVLELAVVFLGASVDLLA